MMNPERQKGEMDFRKIGFLLRKRRKTQKEEAFLASKLSQADFLEPFFDMFKGCEESIGKLLRVIKIHTPEMGLSVVVQPGELNLADELAFFVVKGSVQVFEAIKEANKVPKRPKEDSLSALKAIRNSNKITSIELSSVTDKELVDAFAEKYFPGFMSIGSFSLGPESDRPKEFRVTQKTLVVSLEKDTVGVSVNLSLVQVIKKDFIRKQNKELLEELRKIEEFKGLPEEKMFSLILTGAFSSKNRNTKLVTIGQKAKTVFLVMNGSMELRGKSGKSFSVIFGYSIIGIEFLCEELSSPEFFYEVVCTGSQTDFIEINLKKFEGIMKGSPIYEELLEEAKNVFEFRRKQMNDVEERVQNQGRNAPNSIETLERGQQQYSKLPALPNRKEEFQEANEQRQSMTQRETTKEAYFQAIRPFKSKKSNRNLIHIGFHPVNRSEGMFTVFSSVSYLLEKIDNQKRLEAHNENMSSFLKRDLGDDSALEIQKDSKPDILSSFKKKINKKKRRRLLESLPVPKETPIVLQLQEDPTKNRVPSKMKNNSRPLAPLIPRLPKQKIKEHKTKNETSHGSLIRDEETKESSLLVHSKSNNQIQSKLIYSTAGPKEESLSLSKMFKKGPGFHTHSETSSNLVPLNAEKSLQINDSSHSVFF